MTTYTRPTAIIVSRDSFDSEDSLQIVESNISFINALLTHHLQIDEISVYALQSYYVDYYLAQIENGGFSQFVYNSRWSRATVDLITDGLKSMGASQHLALFNKAESRLNQLEPEDLERFFESDYFGENEERDFLNQYSDEFYTLDEEEDLAALNAQWLRQHPHLVVMTIDEMYADLERQVASIPDIESRVAEALAQEPRYTKIIRKFCHEYELDFDCVTAGVPTEYNGEDVVAWYFVSAEGPYYMIETDGNAFMFDANSDKLVGKITGLDDD
ncbi:MAG: DMP19 family protein [Candidatus Promineifilaceae bacterium]